MSCCKGEQYDNWCENEEIVYKDDDGKEYCVFHAPRGEKQRNVNEFNNLIYKRICYGRCTRTVDLRGTIFEGPVEFINGADVDNILFTDVSFQSVKFKGLLNAGGCEFNNVCFRDSVEFKGNKFRGEVVFDGCELQKELVFNDNKFESNFIFQKCETNRIAFENVEFAGVTKIINSIFGYSTFHKVKFLEYGSSDFSTSVFTDACYFRDVEFEELGDFQNMLFNTVVFQEARFKKGADFRGSEFKEAAHLSGALFNDYASFAGVNFHEIYLTGATFSGWVYFNDMKGNKLFCTEATFNKTEFEGSSISVAEFREAHFNDIIRFSSTLFIEKADFYGATFKEAVFQDQTFGGNANFGAVKIEDEVRFENVNLKKATFSYSFVKKMTFVNVDWPREREDSWNLDDRYVLYDEIEVNMEARKVLDREKCFKKLWLIMKHWFLPQRTEELSKVKVLYNTLKQKCKQEHNEAEASNWHYCEKEMQRRTTSIERSGFMWVFYNLYRYSCGYAEYPLRALLVLILLILLYGFGLKMTGFVPLNDELYVADLTRSGISAVWDYFIEAAKYASFQKDVYFKPVNAIGEIVKLAGKIAIPVQAALFVMAIRNRFRR